MCDVLMCDVTDMRGCEAHVGEGHAASQPAHCPPTDPPSSHQPITLPLINHRPPPPPTACPPTHLPTCSFSFITIVNPASSMSCMISGALPCITASGLISANVFCTSGRDCWGKKKPISRVADAGESDPCVAFCVPSVPYRARRLRGGWGEGVSWCHTGCTGCGDRQGEGLGDAWMH